MVSLSEITRRQLTIPLGAINVLKLQLLSGPAFQYFRAVPLGVLYYLKEVFAFSPDNMLRIFDSSSNLVVVLI